MDLDWIGNEWAFESDGFIGIARPGMNNRPHHGLVFIEEGEHKVLQSSYFFREKEIKPLDLFALSSLSLLVNLVISLVALKTRMI